MQDKLFTPFFIGNIEITNPAFLAPMAGITDYPFRKINREMGAGMMYTEFVSSNGIVRGSEKSIELVKISEKERPIGIQVFGEIPDVVAESSKILVDKYHPDLVDINYGCPVPKVTKRGAGSGILKNLSLMEDMTKAVVNAVDVPVTVKMRAGWDQHNIISTEIGPMLESCGIKAITLHPRTTSQKFTGHSNRQLIKELKDAVSIPVIGNGDVQNVDDFVQMKVATNCDAIMIGRASLGNPWIFKNISDKLLEKPITSTRLLDRFKMCKYHFDLLCEAKLEHVAINLSKKHFSFYLRGFPGASEWRKQFMSFNSKNEFEITLNKLLATLN